LPRESLQLLRQFPEIFRHRLRGSRAFVTQKIAIPKPDNFSRTKEGQGIQRLAQPGNRFQRIAAVGNGGFDDFVTHAAQILRPLREDLPCPLLDSEFIVATNKGQG
jgi:hypothetical protein